MDGCQVKTEENPCALEFLGYRITDIEYTLNEKFNAKEGDIKLSFKNDILTNDKKDRFNVRLSLKVNEKELTTESPYYIKTTIEGIFKLTRELDKIDDYAQISAVSILFPYLRALVSNITANANIVPLIIPPMNVPKMLKKE
ncbi:protein-export chaperone SecB [Methanococcus maripaludis]|uniref:Preprotein translocase subunit SecB n=1 Tax=Methanococcus maripaludis TaxID=39152 RepID=A0A8T4CJC8_METMI|nr:protein-export chaperone SecB [Methanococcus maripaludis]MBM7408790.1 preprotein translocase subunit SecB [Methanococcus maripaludis]MBP2219041.1 preprotein translocase subunit SecB [Methanococcus maripaludis]